MAQKICTANFPETPFVDACDPCRHYYFNRKEAFKYPNGTLIVNFQYDLRTCFEGLAKGPHLSVQTLLPGEEIELEVVRRSKYTKEIHEQRSVESEFENEFEKSVINEFKTDNEFNFRTEVQGGLSILGIGAKVTTSFESKNKISYRRLQEVTQRSSHRVSSSYDISVDTKSEIENTFRSLRKFKNPNPCQPVMYLISQLLKKYKTSLHLLGITYSFIPSSKEIPSILQKLNDRIEIVRNGRISFNDNVNEVINNSPINIREVSDSNISKIRTNANVSVKQPRVEYMELQKEHVPTFSKDLAIENASSKANKENLEKYISDVEKREFSKPREIWSISHCIKTSDIYIETKVSPCTACTEEQLRLQNATIEKIEAETIAITNTTP